MAAGGESMDDSVAYVYNDEIYERCYDHLVVDKIRLTTDIF